MIVVVLGFNEGDGDVGLDVEDVVGALALAARDQPAADDDAALRERDLLADLRLEVPPGLQDGGRDELRAHLALVQVLLVHLRHPRPGI